MTNMVKYAVYMSNTDNYRIVHSKLLGCSSGLFFWVVLLGCSSGLLMSFRYSYGSYNMIYNEHGHPQAGGGAKVSASGSSPWKLPPPHFFSLWGVFFTM